MKLKNKILLTFSALSLLFTTSCSDEFFDVNKNPNDPGESTPKITLPVAQQELADLNATSMTYLGQFMAYNWSTPSNWSANQDLVRYNVTSNFYPVIFQNSYSRVFKNLTYVANYEDKSGVLDYSIYKSISTILKAFQYQYLVDLYGDVPYSEANKRADNTTPKYDDAETIYKDLIDKLTEVVTTLDNLPKNAENPGGQDIIFGGNVAKWQQLANTIKLRYLIRLSNTGQDAYIKSEMAKIVANGKGFITENTEVNPGYQDNEDKLNPFYGDFRKPSKKDDETDRGDYTVATDYALQFFMNNNDKRYTRIYAESAKGDYKGAEQATILPGEGYTSKDLSKVGPGLIKSPDQSQPLMLLSEALFLQSEAVERGYLAGNAKELYNKAIEESFHYLGVEDYEQEAKTYYEQEIPNVSYDFSSNKIQAIITQKWAALNGTSSIESWIELNRTGFPSGLPVPAESGRAQRPYRLLYPATELQRNSNNVPRQSKDDAFTKKIFWQ